MIMAKRPIRKILVANRGEIAVRIIRTCRELGISTVAVYSDADRLMPHVLMADEACHVGPAPSQESYLSIQRILEAARRFRVDAVHPGYGFLSENPEFAQSVRDAGIIFVGPTPESIRAMGDKVRARSLVSKAGVPLVPGTPEPIRNIDDAKDFSNSYGFPILIKAAAGGGGKGMRIVDRMKDFASAFRAAQSESRSAFGDDRVYLEKYLENPRHIEFQILADEQGNILHLGERECTIQRRHQKVIEETPSVIMDEALRTRMGETAVNAAKVCGYRNAGTVEFLVDRDRNFYFLEMNTRLQVEHPITEMRTGLDLVAHQIKIASGEPLAMSQHDIRMNGHAIECRIYAEDVRNNYLPSTGKIVHLNPSAGLGVREDRGVKEGDEVSLYYDPLIAKLVAWGHSRDEALNRMMRALQEYEILGVETNIPLHLFVLSHPAFRDGTFDTHFLERHWSSAATYELDEKEELAVAVVASHISSARDRSHLATKNGSMSTSRWAEQRTKMMRE
jgi:propionyl-CoA carboxylase alpha chain